METRSKIVIEFDPEIPKSHTANQPTAPLGRFTEYYQMIVKLGWTQSTVKQNMEQAQIPGMGRIIRNRTTTLERKVPEPLRPLNVFLLLSNIRPRF